MSGEQPQGPAQAQDNGPPEERDPGFCSATCTDKKAGRAEIAKPDLKTSDLFVTCNLPKRFEHPRKFRSFTYFQTN